MSLLILLNYAFFFWGRKLPLITRSSVFVLFIQYCIHMVSIFYKENKKVDHQTMIIDIKCNIISLLISFL